MAKGSMAMDIIPSAPMGRKKGSIPGNMPGIMKGLIGAVVVAGIVGLAMELTGAVRIGI